MRFARLLVLALSVEMAPAALADTSSAPTPSSSAPSAADPKVQAADAKIDPHLFDAEPPEAAETSAWSLLRMFVALGVVLGLVYISLNWGLRKMMGARAGSWGGSSVVKVVERVPLDPKSSLFVIKAAGEHLLVGRGEQGLSLLCKLDSVEVERIEREKSAPGAPLSPFLQKLLSRRGPPPPTA